MVEMKSIGPDSLKKYTYRDLPIGAVSIGMDPLGRRTGLWRYHRPSFVEKIPPCENSCPLGNWIQKFLSEVASGNIENASKTLRLENPLPGVCGRVCPHHCERSCNRTDLGGAVAIRDLERFISEYSFDCSHISVLPRLNNKSVAVIGSGPAGLSFAYFSALLGHKVKIYESESVLGGIPRIGIPDYRLPQVVIDKEISNILSLGIQVKTNCRIDKDLSMKDLLLEHDGVFIASGAPKSVFLGIPGENLPGVSRGLDILRKIKIGENIPKAQDALVIGGGNVAMDVARTLVRHGYNVKIVYRRTRNEMPAFPEEITEAAEENIGFTFLVSPVSIDCNSSQRLELKCQVMELKGLDASGRPKPVPMNGKFETFIADQIVIASGENPDLSHLPAEFKIMNGSLWTNSLGQTSVPNVFAGGDITAVPRTVADAIGSGKRAAMAMDSYFNGNGVSPDSVPQTMREYLETADNRYPVCKEVVKLEGIALNYNSPDERHVSPAKLSSFERSKSFAEFSGTYSKQEAVAESKRCLSCGRCKMCGNCYLYCPDASIKLSPEGDRYLINYDYCKGCGICQNECPVGAILSEPEKE